MDAIPPRFDVPAEVRRVDCTREEPCLVKADDAPDHHGANERPEPDDGPRGGVVTPPAEDLPPGRQVFDIPQRVWREQAEQLNRVAQIVQMMNRSAAADWS